eukprot:1452359-Pyramimonas_sp.AAC.2
MSLTTNKEPPEWVPGAQPVWDRRGGSHMQSRCEDVTGGVPSRWGPQLRRGAAGKSIKLSKLSSTEEWEKRRTKGRRSIRNLVMNVSKVAPLSVHSPSLPANSLAGLFPLPATPPPCLRLLWTPLLHCFTAL